MKYCFSSNTIIFICMNTSYTIIVAYNLRYSTRTASKHQYNVELFAYTKQLKKLLEIVSYLYHVIGIIVALGLTIEELHDIYLCKILLFLHVQFASFQCEFQRECLKFLWTVKSNISLILI